MGIIELIQSLAILLYMTSLMYIKEISITFAVVILAYTAFYIIKNRKSESEKLDKPSN